MDTLMLFFILFIVIFICLEIRKNSYKNSSPAYRKLKKKNDILNELYSIRNIIETLEKRIDILEFDLEEDNGSFEDFNKCKKRTIDDEINNDFLKGFGKKTKQKKED